MATTYNVGIARRDGSVDGWVFDLPGCRAIGATADEVLTLLPVVIADHIVWLDGHGEVTRDAFPFDVKVVEDVSSTSEFCFEADRAALTDEHLEQAVRHIGWAHADLVQRTRELPDIVLDWKPPASAVKIDAIYPDVRSIREMLAHIAAAMTFHIRGVGDVTERVPDPECATLFNASDTTLSRLRGLNEEERSGKVYTRTGPRGESEWSARKAVRRIANHIRFHAREVEQRLCWLTLGVPEVLPVSRE
jgi:hypothetical protein